jgi:hypothetical protein
MYNKMLVILKET